MKKPTTLDHATANFANHPQSLSEIRADASANGDDMTPRDALIATLRDLDLGNISPDHLIIVWRDSAKRTTGAANGGCGDPCIAAGLLEMAKATLLDEVRN